MPPDPVSSLLVGDSPSMQRLRDIVAVVAPTHIPVLIEGETGTGKEHVAALLHAQSGRSGAFVAFNICALGESMFEDALFGHVRGAYTGAIGESLGFLREANGGTVFLDEVGELAEPMQVKLLRAVEMGVFRPIGSSRDARSDFRTVAATNRRLDDLVAGGSFRADFLHRLAGFVITVPPLGDRVDDIPELVEHFARRTRTVTVTRRATRALQERSWPGNVRELKQVVDAAMIFAGDTLDVDAIDVALAHRPRRAPKHDGLSVERNELMTLLSGAAWDTERAAATLGVHRTTLYRRAKKLGIRIPIAARGDGGVAHLSAQ